MDDGSQGVEWESESRSESKSARKQVAEIRSEESEI
jgi:hypothetical protein